MIQLNKVDKTLLIGTLIALGSSLAYVIFGLLSKALQNQLPFNYLIFLQSCAGLASTILFLHLSRFKWAQLRIDFHRIYFYRIIASLSSAYLFIYGLQYLQLYNALVILNICPLLMPTFRSLLLNKKINNAIYIYMLIAFGGVVTILAPDKQIFHLKTIIIVASMLCMIFSVLLLENKRSTNSNLAVFYYFFISTIVTACGLIYYPASITVSTSTLLLSLLSGVLFFLTQFFLIYAAKYISSQLIAVIFYSEIVFSLIAALLMSTIDWHLYLLIGTLLILFGSYKVVMADKGDQYEIQ